MTTTFGRLEVENHLDSEGDLEFELYGETTYLNVHQIESLILHLQNALTSKKSDHEQTHS